MFALEAPMPPSSRSDDGKTVRGDRQRNGPAHVGTRHSSITRGHGNELDLWTGITAVRLCAGVAVVGNPKQVAAQLQELIDVGCSGFCLSGYPHHEEAERFGRLVMPLFQNRA